MDPSGTPPPYEAVPYPGHAFAQTHPDRLATLAALFGLDPAAPADCRLLEIGCGDGGNLLPMAQALPRSTFVGIDSSPGAIAHAQRIAAELSLDNVDFRLVGVEDFQAPAASFDYAITHGVFSWVPEHVRDRLLALVAHVLDDQGVAYVSYNAMPGARVPQTLREFLRLKLDGVRDPGERMAQARRLLAMLAGPDGNATVLGAEAAMLLDRPDALLFHDALAEINVPFFFSEFAALAAGHGLQYLAEANFLEMQGDVLPHDLQLELAAEADVVRQEQMLDYVKVRRFRQTLLCRAAVEVDRVLRAERIAGFAVSAPTRGVAEDPANPARVTFGAPGGSRLTTEDEAVIAVLRLAGERWPAAVRVRDALGDEPSAEVLERIGVALLRCYAANLVQLHVHLPQLVTHVSERPVASPLARLQVREQAEIANLRHATIPMGDDTGRRLLSLLDGTRDRDALLAAVPELGAEGLDAALALFARSSLLVA